jgi:hypothetical protein
MAASHGSRPGEAERVQKVLAQLGLASRREAESWIRAGRLTVNGKPAELGMRVIPQDQIKLDGRLIRRQPAAKGATPVFVCHRSPGEPLLPVRGARCWRDPQQPGLAPAAPRGAALHQCQSLAAGRWRP